MDLPTDERVAVRAYKNCTIAPEVTEANRQALLAALDASAAGDRGPFVALFDPDMVFHEADCLPYGGAHRGSEAVAKAHAKLRATYDRIHVVTEQVAAAGDLVFMYQQLDFRVRRNGRTGSLPLTELFRFRGGKVIEWRALYFDANMVAETINAD